MKKLLCLLLTLALLAGCTPKTPEQTAPPPVQTTAAVQPTAEAPTEAPVTILDHAVPWQNDPQLLQLQLPEEPWNGLDVMEERMLLFRIDYSEDGTQGRMVLSTVDLRTGEPTGRREVPVSGYFVPQILQDTVVLCDNNAGIIYRWDRDLEPIGRWELPPDSLTWCLGYRDGEEVLYRMGYQMDLTAENLRTGEKTTIVRQNRNFWSAGILGGQLQTMCVEGPNLLQYACTVDLLTGEVRRIPTEHPMISATRVGEIWLGHGASDSEYYLVPDGEPLRIRQEFTTFQQLSDGCLLQICQDSPELRIYGPRGEALGVCRPTQPQDQSSVWQAQACPLLGGYLLPVYNWEGIEALLLWQPDPAYEGEDLVLEMPQEPEGSGGTAVDAALYERAAGLGERYGVEIYIADRIDTDSSTFTVEPMLDEAQIAAGLDLLERVLGSYPEGFFRQLRWENVRRLQIHLGGRIYSGDSYRIDGAYSGFVVRPGDACQVVISLGSSNELTYAHEFSHVIDQKLQWDSECRSDSAYSEEAWLALNPRDFEYTYDYGNVAPYFEGEDRELYGWFLSPYSMVNPTEDRAQIMEAAVGVPWAFDEGPGMLRKLRWYSDCIRDCFDTTGWPEKTVWEQVLK